MHIGHWTNARPTGEPRCRAQVVGALWWTVHTCPGAQAPRGWQVSTGASGARSLTRAIERLSTHLNSDDGDFTSPCFPLRVFRRRQPSTAPDPRPFPRRPPIARPRTHRSTTTTPTTKQAFHSRRWRFAFADAHAHADRDKTPAACDVAAYTPPSRLCDGPRSAACLPGLPPSSHLGVRGSRPPSAAPLPIRAPAALLATLSRKPHRGALGSREEEGVHLDTRDTHIAASQNGRPPGRRRLQAIRASKPPSSLSCAPLPPLHHCPVVSVPAGCEVRARDATNVPAGRPIPFFGAASHPTPRSLFRRRRRPRARAHRPPCRRPHVLRPRHVPRLYPAARR